MNQGLQALLNTRYATRKEALDEWVYDVVEVQNPDRTTSLYQLRQFYEMKEKELARPFRKLPETAEYVTYYQYVKK